jgi:hypothetical protein
MSIQDELIKQLSDEHLAQTLMNAAGEINGTVTPRMADAGMGARRRYGEAVTEILRRYQANQEACLSGSLGQIVRALRGANDPFDPQDGSRFLKNIELPPLSEEKKPSPEPINSFRLEP